MRPVQIGISDYEYAQVLNGLSDGDVVSLVRPDLANIVQPPPETSAESTQTNEVARNDGSQPATAASGTTNRSSTTM